MKEQQTRLHERRDFYNRAADLNMDDMPELKFNDFYQNKRSKERDNNDVPQDKLEEFDEWFLGETDKKDDEESDAEWGQDVA